MVAAEFKSSVSTVRIHDEYCEGQTDPCIARLSRIISASYKRRQLASWEGEAPPEIVAAHISANVMES